MLFRIVPSPKNALSSHQALELINIYLENALKTMDDDIALVLCHEAETYLSQVKNASKRLFASPKDTGDLTLQEGMATAYIELAKLMGKKGYQDEAEVFSEKAEKLRVKLRQSGQLVQSSRPNSSLLSESTSLNSSVGTVPVNPSPPTLDKQQRREIDVLPAHIFAEKPQLPAIDFKLPGPDDRLSSTPHLVYCLILLQASHLINDIQDPATRTWIQVTENDKDEKERLK
ncbi:hypothetical protein BGZ65_001609, partial [Modicella reniformis]